MADQPQGPCPYLLAQQAWADFESNPDGKLVVSGFGRENPPLSVPASKLLFRSINALNQQQNLRVQELHLCSCWFSATRPEDTEAWEWLVNSFAQLSPDLKVLRLTDVKRFGQQEQIGPNNLLALLLFAGRMKHLQQLELSSQDLFGDETAVAMKTLASNVGQLQLHNCRLGLRVFEGLVLGIESNNGMVSLKFLQNDCGVYDGGHILRSIIGSANNNHLRALSVDLRQSRIEIGQTTTGAVPSLTALLQQCQNLEELEMHFCQNALFSRNTTQEEASNAVSSFYNAVAQRPTLQVLRFPLVPSPLQSGHEELGAVLSPLLQCMHYYGSRLRVLDLGSYAPCRHFLSMLPKSLPHMKNLECLRVCLRGNLPRLQESLQPQLLEAFASNTSLVAVENVRLSTADFVEEDLWPELLPVLERNRRLKLASKFLGKSNRLQNPLVWKLCVGEINNVPDAVYRFVRESVTGVLSGPPRGN